jgi:hypothetical protein
VAGDSGRVVINVKMMAKLLRAEEFYSKMLSANLRDPDSKYDYPFKAGEFTTERRFIKDCLETMRSCVFKESAL